MSQSVKDIRTFRDLFIHTLRDVLYAERHIARTTRMMIGRATSRLLATALEEHLAETDAQLRRLDQVFALLGEEARANFCEAINGILDEAESIIDNVTDPVVLDAAMLAAAQSVEHYEITRYGTLHSWAREMGEEKIAVLLAETLIEERRADARLTTVGVGRVNRRAA